MSYGGSRGEEPADLLAVFESGRGRVDFLGASRGARQLALSGERLADALARRGFTHGRRIVLLLTNTPTLFIILYAAFRLGLRVLLLDPRQDQSALERRLKPFRPELLFTSNPAPLFDKVLRLLPSCPSGMPVVVERFTDLLPFPRNLLAPLLRGGGIATLPPDPRFMRYGDFIRAAVDARSPERAPPGPLELADEVVEPDALLKKVMGAAAPAPGRERWLIAASLAEIDVLAQALRALHAGADLVLSPRLDRRTLDKVARQAGTVREIR